MLKLGMGVMSTPNNLDSTEVLQTAIKDESLFFISRVREVRRTGAIKKMAFLPEQALLLKGVHQNEIQERNRFGV